MSLYPLARVGVWRGIRRVEDGEAGIVDGMDKERERYVLVCLGLLRSLRKVNKRIEED